MKQQGDAGFGLVEIIVSIFMLALLAIGVLPLLITALKTGQTNASTAAATQLLADALARAEQAGQVSCFLVAELENDFPAIAAATDAAVTYGLSATFQVHDACPPSIVEAPSIVSITVEVSNASGVVAAASQLIYVAHP